MKQSGSLNSLEDLDNVCQSEGAAIPGSQLYEKGTSLFKALVALKKDFKIDDRFPTLKASDWFVTKTLQLNEDMPGQIVSKGLLKSLFRSDGNLLNSIADVDGNSDSTLKVWTNINELTSFESSCLNDAADQSSHLNLASISKGKASQIEKARKLGASVEQNCANRLPILCVQMPRQ